jgi:hypothetical protein
MFPKYTSIRLDTTLIGIPLARFQKENNDNITGRQTRQYTNKFKENAMILL